MKVLYIIDSLEGYGAEKSIVELALNFKNIIPVFVYLSKGDKLKSKLEKNGVQVYSLDLVSNSGKGDAIKLLIPIINLEQPLIIHSTLFKADMVARKLKRYFPNIYLVGSFVSNSYGTNRFKNLSPLSKIKLFTTQIKDRLSAGKVDYFICNSNAIKKTNLQALDVSERKVKVIYRGRCFKDIKASEIYKNSLKNEFNIRDQKVFLNVSRLHKDKGQADLIRAFGLLHQENDNIVLLIAGEGSYRNELEKLIEELNLEKKVVLLGYREDIPELFSICDFFVFPTYYEGLPGALIEAIISKTPCIVSSIPENVECFENGGALFFDSGDIEDLKLRLEEAFRMDNWESLTQIAHFNASEKFDIQKVSKEYERFYQEILVGLHI